LVSGGSFTITSGLGSGIALGPNAIYWANSGNGTIGTANLDGSGVNQSLISGSSGLTAVSDVTVSGNFIYFLGSLGSTPVIGRANLDGTAVAGLTTHLGTAQNNVSLVSDGTYIYWTNSGGFTGPAFIGRVSINGQNPNPFFIPLNGFEPFGLALDPAGTHLYWSDPSQSAIFRANIDGTGMVKVLSGLGPQAPFGQSLGVDVDKNYIYWTDFTLSDTSVIGRANIDGTGQQTFIIPPLCISCSGTEVSGVAVVGGGPPGALVPEPTTGLLLMAGMLGLAVARRVKA